MMSTIQNTAENKKQAANRYAFLMRRFFFLGIFVFLIILNALLMA